MILDEVISGFRLALGGAQERFKITPDLATLGKVTGGGFPVGAVVGKKEILERTAADRKGKKSEKDSIGGGTFSAHPCTAAAGLAMIHHLKDHADEVYPVLEARGETVRKGRSGGDADHMGSRAPSQGSVRSSRPIPLKG